MAKQCPTHEDSQLVLARHLDLKQDYWNHCVIPQSKLELVFFFLFFFKLLLILIKLGKEAIISNYSLFPKYHQARLLAYWMHFWNT